ncbi:MAG TPA: hypothetical protein VH186_15545 [Chloroflexia bacterium]|nr:hypothetical protein [Chloroflexia bacterium]
MNEEDIRDSFENTSAVVGNVASTELARKVRYLFETIKKPNGNSYSYNEVEKLTDGKVEQSWLSKMAKGMRQRPHIQSLEALTDFFGIDPTFWFISLDEWISNQSQKEYDENVADIATRAKYLSPEGQRMVINLMQNLEKSGKFKRVGEGRGKRNLP